MTTHACTEDQLVERLERVRVIDWEHPVVNDFLLVSQFSVTGALYTYRARQPRLQRFSETRLQLERAAHRKIALRWCRKTAPPVKRSFARPWPKIK